MEHILKYSEWESNGRWQCTDVSNFAKGSAYWYHVPQMLGISYTDYIYLLRDKYNVHYMSYTAKYNVLTFAFDTLQECRKFKNDINRIARQKKYYIY